MRHTAGICLPGKPSMKNLLQVEDWDDGSRDTQRHVHISMTAMQGLSSSMNPTIPDGSPHIRTVMISLETSCKRRKSTGPARVSTTSPAVTLTTLEDA